jgi:cytosine/creatinine deaminase
VNTADIVAASGGVLGMVTYPIPDLKAKLLAFFRMAADRGLHADFHVDETGDPSVATLRMIAETVLETGFDAPVVVGHCCSSPCRTRPRRCTRSTSWRGRGSTS